MSDNEGEESEQGEGQLLTEAGHQISKDIHSLTSCINPSFEGSTADRVGKLEATHLYLTLYYLFALIALSISVGLVTKLGASRALTLQISVITPPINSTGDTYQDAFQVVDHPLSKLPVTVLICVMAGIYFAYHALHGVVYREWTKHYVNCRSNVSRWITIAGARTMEVFVLFSLNGERQLSAFVLLVASTVAVCYLAHWLDVAASCCYMKTKAPQKEQTVKVKKHTKKGAMLLSCWKDVVHAGQALLLVTAILVAAFLIRICYNNQATPLYVTGLSIAFVIVHALSAFYYVWVTWNTSCDESCQEYIFVRGDWRISMYNAILFTVLAPTLFAEQVKM